MMPNVSRNPQRWNTVVAAIGVWVRLVVPGLLAASICQAVGTGGAAQPQNQNVTSSGPPVAADQDVPDQPPAPASNRDLGAVKLVKVPLPISSRVAAEVAQHISRLRDSLATRPVGAERPLLILEFETHRGATGAGSSFTACLELAQLLTHPDMNRIKTIAYLPGRANIEAGAPADQPAPRLIGHAVLVAIAAEELVLDESVTLGPANSDEPQLNLLAIDVYRNLAERRLNLPVEVVTSLIDPRQSLYRVTLADGDRLVNQKGLEDLEREGRVVEAETLSAAGTAAEFSATVLARAAVNVRPVANRQQLANRLAINLATLEAETADGRRWKAVEYRFSDYMDQRSVDWAIRALDQSLRADGTNMAIFKFDLYDADADAAMRLANYLADLDSEQIRTVALIEQAVTGPAAMCALLCDHLLMTETSTIGGEYSTVPEPDELQRLLFELRAVADRKQRSFSLLRYQLDPQAALARWRNNRTGEIRWMDEEEQRQLDDPQLWQVLEAVAGAAPITAAMAERDGLARHLIGDVAEVDSYYQLAEPARVLTPTGADRFIQWLARWLASPAVAFWLLFGGMFLISTEMSNPGVGVPGFLGTLCFVLFFWSQYLDGNAGWLEILLFVLGVVFVGFELFVLPGFGIFGVGGLLMIVISIVLASQTFIIPHNAKEFRQLPVSLGMVCGALLGMLAALYVLRRYLPHAPFFRRLMLDPPALATEGFALENSDSLFPPGIRGKSVTRLMPSGKARIAGRVVDVLTDGRIVEARQTIEVVEAVGNRIVVAPVETATEPDS